MKKYYHLILVIITCFIILLYKWFLDNLISLFSIIFFPFSLITIIIIFVNLIKLLSNRLKKDKNIINKVSLYIVYITIFIFVFIPFSTIKFNLEFKLFSKERDIIIDKIKNNEFKYYYDKNIKLPIYKYLSVDGEIYVYQNDEDGTQIGFWIHRGVLTGSEELMYSSNGEKLIKENETDHPIKSIKKLNKYWYYVITEY